MSFLIRLLLIPEPLGKPDMTQVHENLYFPITPTETLPIWVAF